ncbi:MAG: ABC transporter permease [Nocardioidaceae bacterium]
MRHRHGGLTLLAALLRGLRSRATLTLGAFVLAAVAVASAVVGPAYQASSAQSFLVTRLQHALPVSTGVSITYRPSGDTTSLADELRHTATVGTEHLRGLFGPATVSVESSPDTVRHLFGFPWSGATVLAAKAGACAHLVITGSCPRQPGDVIMREAAAVSAHVKVGDRLPFTGYPGRLRVVGVYSLPNDPAAFWFDESRLTSSAPQAARGGAILFEPGPIITDSATIGRLASESLTFHIDRSLSVDAQTTADDVRRARQAVVDLPQYLTTLHDGRYKATEDNSLQFVLADIEQNRGTARDTVTPAVVSLVLVALALLARLLGAAADQRRHELALGSLRGLSARQMWAFGLAEPVLLLLLATPAGFALGYATTLWLSRRWLVSGIPVSLGTGSAIAGALVLLAAVAASVLAVSGALREPLSAQLAGVRRPGRSGRWVVVTKAALVAAAVVVVAASLTASGRSAPRSTDLVLPLLLAGATGLLVTAGVVQLARWWARRTSGRPGVTGFVASRAVSRRREGSLVILPLTAALAIAVFAAGVYGAADAWRRSTAATEVGAAQAYRSAAPLDQTVALTRELDPQGKWLMAAGVIVQGSYGEKLVLDTSRLARVGVWPSTWTPGLDAAAVAQELGPHGPGVWVQGRSFSLALDNQVNTGTDALGVSLQVQTAGGDSRTMFFGPFKSGESTATTKVSFCRQRCRVDALLIGGPATSATTLSGSASLLAFTEDGRADNPLLDAGAWRPVTSPLGLSAGSTQVSQEGPRLVVRVDTGDSVGIGGITPSDVPAYRPVLMGRTEATKILGGSGDHLVAETDALEGLPITPVGVTDSMPFLGPRGLLIDYTMMTRDQSIPPASTDVYVLARGDTPASVTKALTAHGASSPASLSAAKQVLDQDAYALSLNLYLVAALAAVALALAGLAVNLAVQLPDRRRDAASLRVVGVRRRQIVRAIFVELSAVLGAAGIAGILAGSAAQYIVVRTVTLGVIGDIRTPRVVATLDATRLGVLMAVVLLALVGVSTFVAAVTVQRARAATLRESPR